MWMNAAVTRAYMELVKIWSMIMCAAVTSNTLGVTATTSWTPACLINVRTVLTAFLKEIILTITAIAQGLDSKVLQVVFIYILSLLFWNNIVDLSSIVSKGDHFAKVLKSIVSKGDHCIKLFMFSYIYQALYQREVTLLKFWRSQCQREIIALKFLCWII